jgi:hypothetical protein
MSVSSDDSTLTVTLDDGSALLSSTFLEFCAQVRNNDSSILPEPGEPFKIFLLRDQEVMELGDALLKNTSITYLKLETVKYTKRHAEAMAKYVRTSNCLQRISWNPTYRVFQQREEMLCCFLPAFQESTALKELRIESPRGGRASNRALENMLTYTQSLRSLSLKCLDDRLEDMFSFVTAVRSGLKRNNTLRELTLEDWRGTTISPILTSLRDHPLLRRLCLRGHDDVMNVTGLETLLLSENSKIKELEICRDTRRSKSPLGLPHVLRALGRHTALTKLGLRHCTLGRNNARLLRMALCNIPTLQSLVLSKETLRSAALAELAPALYHNTSIKVLDISGNLLDDMVSAEILRDILRHNKQDHDHP